MSIDSNLLWLTVFSQVVGIRFHPRNDGERASILMEVSLAADVADWALKVAEERGLCQ